MGETKLHVELLRHTEGVEELVAIAAKICYSGADIGELQAGIEEKDQGPFLEKLMEMGHHSPIEHASFTFGIEGVSRSLLAQITRHRLASFSVKSQRYVGEVSEGGDEFDYVIPPSIAALGEDAAVKYREQMHTIQGWYDEWVKALGGREREKIHQDARFVLPNACETKMIVTMNARELRHFFALRCCNRAQWEIQALATRMLQLVKEVAPTLFADAGPGCMQGTCPEGKMSCGRAEEMRERFSKHISIVL
jgi:thymidylate synthase (FAD)